MHHWPEANQQIAKAHEELAAEEAGKICEDMGRYQSWI
jgi:hypothetical protein